MAVPRVMHVREKARQAGPTVIAPEDVIEQGPTPTSGFVKYRKGDAVPVGEAIALGWVRQAPRSDDEPAPRNASVRGRTVRVANRLGTQHEDPSGTV